MNYITKRQNVNRAKYQDYENFSCINASTAYNILMENVMIPQVVVETPSYLRAVENFWDNDTQIEFKNFIAANALIGDVIPNTGRLRKIRWFGKGHVKRGGVRVIYYFYNENHPIYLLFAYPKNVQEDLSENEKKIMRTLVSQLKFSFRTKERKND